MTFVFLQELAGAVTANTPIFTTVEPAEIKFGNTSYLVVFEFKTSNNNELEATLDDGTSWARLAAEPVLFDEEEPTDEFPANTWIRSSILVRQGDELNLRFKKSGTVTLRAFTQTD